MRKIAIAISISLLPLSAIPSNAMQNGISALGHSRIVSVNRDNHGGCTGWLYSERLVFTNAHCVLEWEKRPQIVEVNPTRMSVSKPGTTYDFSFRSKHLPVVKVFRSQTYDWYRAEIGGTLSYKDDFAVIVLGEAVPNTEKAFLVTPEQVAELIKNKSMVWTGGYGLQSAEDRERQNKGVNRDGLEPKKANYQVISNEEGMAKVNEYKQNWNRNYFQEISVFVRVPMNGPAPCDGDSGSGFFLEDGNKFTYLGVTHTNIGNPNCGMDKPTSDGITGFAPVYLFADYVKAAEDYVAANPLKIAITKSITCKKGKKTKSVSGTNPKCPAGYKKTAKSI